MDVTLLHEDGQWRLEPVGKADGLRVMPPPAKDLREAYRRLGMDLDPVADHGAVLNVGVAKNAGLRRWEFRRIEAVKQHGPIRAATVREEADREEDLKKRAEAAQERTARRAGRQRRAWGGSTPPDAARRAGLYEEERAGQQDPEVNPYTFLPYVQSPPDDRWQPAPDRTAPAPDAHLRSGRIRLRLHVTTPVAVGGETETIPATHEADATGAFGPASKAGDHGTVRPRLDAAGNPVVPGSSLKGVLRTWYEAITSSTRRADPSPVAWRSTAIAAAPDGGTARMLGRLELVGANELAAANEHYKNTDDPRGWRVPAAHIHPIRQWEHGLTDLPDGDRAVNERVDRIARRTIEVWKPATLKDGLAVKVDGVDGRLKVGQPVGKPPRVSLQVVIDDLGVRPIDVLPDVLRQWVAAHREAGAAQRGLRTHGLEVIRPDPTTLRDGDLVWYQLDAAGQVVYLGRIRNGRWAALSPLDGRTPEAHRRPSADRLSPAERVFGTVNENGTTNPAALAGRVRVTAARWQPPEPGERWTDHSKDYTLIALSTPKLSAAGFYLDADDDVGGRQDVSWADRTSRLAGTKVYWHTVSGEGLPADTRVRCAVDDDGRPAKTSQNKTVTAITGGSFVCDLYFEDLTNDELGALLLACNLNFDGDADDPRGWKIGIGKPVGLGSVRNDVERVEEAVGWAEDPISMTYALVAIEPLVARALGAFIPKSHDQDTFADIASHHTLDGRRVGYPPLGRLPRKPGGGYTAQPSTAGVTGLETGRREPMKLTSPKGGRGR